MDEDGAEAVHDEHEHYENEGRALELELVQNPQDGSADTAVSLALSSSYITYSAATLQRLQDFFHVEEVSEFDFHL